MWSSRARTLRTVRKAVFSMIATKRLSTLAGFSPSAQALGANIAQFKEESEKEQVDEVRTSTLRALSSCHTTNTLNTAPQDRDVVHYGGHGEGHSDDASSKEELKKRAEELNK